MDYVIDADMKNYPPELDPEWFPDLTKRKAAIEKSERDAKSKWRKVFDKAKAVPADAASALKEGLGDAAHKLKKKVTFGKKVPDEIELNYVGTGVTLQLEARGKLSRYHSDQRKYRESNSYKDSEKLDRFVVNFHPFSEYFQDSSEPGQETPNPVKILYSVKLKKSETISQGNAAVRLATVVRAVRQRTPIQLLPTRRTSTITCTSAYFYLFARNQPQWLLRWKPERWEQFNQAVGEVRYEELLPGTLAAFAKLGGARGLEANPKLIQALEKEAADQEQRIQRRRQAVQDEVRASDPTQADDASGSVADGDASALASSDAPDVQSGSSSETSGDGEPPELSELENLRKGLVMSLCAAYADDADVGSGSASDAQGPYTLAAFAAIGRHLEGEAEKKDEKKKKKSKRKKSKAKAPDARPLPEGYPGWAHAIADKQLTLYRMRLRALVAKVEKWRADTHQRDAHLPSSKPPEERAWEEIRAALEQHLGALTESESADPELGPLRKIDELERMLLFVFDDHGTLRKSLRKGKPRGVFEPYERFLLFVSTGFSAWTQKGQARLDAQELACLLRLQPEPISVVQSARNHLLGAYKQLETIKIKGADSATLPDTCKQILAALGTCWEELNRPGCLYVLVQKDSWCRELLHLSMVLEQEARLVRALSEKRRTRVFRSLPFASGKTKKVTARPELLFLADLAYGLARLLMDVKHSGYAVDAEAVNFRAAQCSEVSAPADAAAKPEARPTAKPQAQVEPQEGELLTLPAPPSQAGSRAGPLALEAPPPMAALPAPPAKKKAAPSQLPALPAPPPSAAPEASSDSLPGGISELFAETYFPAGSLSAGHSPYMLVFELLGDKKQVQTTPMPSGSGISEQPVGASTTKEVVRLAWTYFHVFPIKLLGDISSAYHEVVDHAKRLAVAEALEPSLVAIARIKARVWRLFRRETRLEKSLSAARRMLQQFDFVDRLGLEEDPRVVLQGIRFCLEGLLELIESPAVSTTTNED